MKLNISLFHVYTHTGVLGHGVNAGGGCWSEVQESEGTGGERLETASDHGEEQEQEESEGIYCVNVVPVIDSVSLSNIYLFTYFIWVRGQWPFELVITYTLYIPLSSIYQSGCLCLSSIYLFSTYLFSMYLRMYLSLTEANKAVIGCQVNRGGIREASGSS